VANSPQAIKRARQAEKARQHNMSLRSKMRTFIKKVQAEVEKGDLKKAQEAFKTAVPVIDSMAIKGILHHNTAARYKSRLNARIKKAAATAAA